MNTKASTGITLNIYEGQIDSKTCDIGKINAIVIATHGDINLSTVVCADFGLFPKWNQVFHLEKQGEFMDLQVFHKPLLMEKIKLGSCTVQVSNQNGWVHLFNKAQRVGSLKIGIFNEIATSSPSEGYELYHKTLQDLQILRSETQKYKEKYLQEKSRNGKQKNLSKINDLILSLQDHQEKYTNLRDEVNEKKKFLKDEEEKVLNEKVQIAKARKIASEEEKELQKLTAMLRRDYNEIQQTRYKLSIQERIFKGSHRNSKSEGRSPSIPTSPYSKAQSTAGLIGSISNY